GDGAPRRDRAPPARRARGGQRRARVLLRRARRRPRIPALHAAGRVPRLERPRRAPLREPQADRRVAPRAKQGTEHAVSEQPPETTGTPVEPSEPTDGSSALRPPDPDAHVVAPRPEVPHEPEPHSRNPLERMGVPQPWRTIID